MKRKPAKKKAAPRKAKAPGTAVAAYVPPPLPADATPTQAMLHGIMAFARDKSVSVEKFERALAIQERLVANEQKRSFDIAYAQMQPKLPVIEKNGRIIIRDKNDKSKIIQSTPYPKWEDIQDAVTPILHEHGFSLRFRPVRSPDGKVQTIGILAHVDGHREEGELDLGHDASGSKNNVQAVGSSKSYAKRYIATDMLNLRFKGEDDDAQAAGGTPDPGTLTADQVKRLQAAMASTKQPLSRVLNYVNINAKLANTPHEIKMLQDIPADWFDRTLAAVTSVQK